MLFYSGIILIGIAVFILANQLFTGESEFKVQEKLDDAGQATEKKKHGIVLEYSRPFFKRYVSPIISNMKNKKKIREQYKRKLSSAGLGQELTPEDFYAFKLFLILAFPILFVVIRTFLEETWPLILVIPIAGVGYIYPNIWLNGKIEQRQKEIFISMPFIVDMLALSVEAGLDFVAAMNKVIEKAPPTALSEEFEIALKEIKIGASRAEALRSMAWRIDLLAISSFCATLISADAIGASIGPILKALSAELRQKRSADAEKEGAKAATKILFPMMAFIIPAVFLIIAAPIGLEMMAANQ